MIRVASRSHISSRGIRLIVLGILVLACLPSFALRESIAYEKRWVAGVSAHVVTVDLNDSDIRISPELTRYGIGRSESWSSMISRARPTAAITGTFFDTRSFYPTGDIFVDGNLACRGRVGTAVCLGRDNKVSFIPLKRGQCRDWVEFQHVLVAGPLLIADGHLSVYPKDQGFKDPRLFARRPRTAVGLTSHNKLIFVATTRPMYLSRLAKAMRALGAVQAAALDGGSSTALYYRGKSLAAPNRRLTNLLVAYDSSAGYEQVRSLLAPDLNRMTRVSNIIQE